MSSANPPWRHLRHLEPPLGARRRVLAALEQELALDRPEPERNPVVTPARRRRWLWLAPAVTLAAAILVAVLVTQADSTAHSDAPPPTRASESTAAASTTAPEVAPAASQATAPTAPRIHADAAERMSIELAAGTVDVVGPASLLAGRDRLEVDFGALDITGRVVVATSMCQATVSGRARVEVTASAVDVAVFAGSAEIDQTAGQCSVHRVTPLELAAAPKPQPGASRPPAEQTTPARPGPVRDRRAATPGPASRAPADQRASQRLDVDPPPAAAPAQPHPAEAGRDVDASLRHQVAQFRRARALTDRKAALLAWREFVATWPDSPLRQEADGFVVDLLVDLGRLDQARSEAAGFSSRYPGSARAAEMKALAGGNGDPQ